MRHGSGPHGGVRSLAAPAVRLGRAVLLVGGLVAKEAASDPFLKGIGRGAANIGWRMMLLAAAFYLLLRALAAVFENMISNLPGA